MKKELEVQRDLGAEAHFFFSPAPDLSRKDPRKSNKTSSP
jgi:hypothetical protein